MVVAQTTICNPLFHVEEKLCLSLKESSIKVINILFNNIHKINILTSILYANSSPIVKVN